MNVYLPISGRIQRVIPNPENGRIIQIYLQSSQGLRVFHVFPDTLIPEARPLRPGAFVYAFYDPSVPMPLIYPPTYEAVIITAPKPGYAVCAFYADENLCCEDISLCLVPSDQTALYTANGQDYYGDIRNHMLLIYYRDLLSYPSRTIIPEKLIILS